VGGIGAVVRLIYPAGRLEYRWLRFRADFGSALGEVQAGGGMALLGYRFALR